jgi:hypothetical protein
MALKPTSGMGATTVSDGRKLYSYTPMLGKYTETPADPLLFDLQAGAMAAHAGMPSAGNFAFKLLAFDPYRAITMGVTSASYVGEEALDGEQARHLRFVQHGSDWELWVGLKEPTVRRVVTGLSNVTKMMASKFKGMPGVGEMKIVVTEKYSQWEVNPKLPADTFTFTPPAGAQKMERPAIPVMPQKAK